MQCCLRCDIFFVWLQTLLCLRTAQLGEAGGPLAGPGTVTEYRAGGRRHGGWGVVGKWPVGFFVAGSTLLDLNGLYERSDPDPSLPHRCWRYYRNLNKQGWALAEVEVRTYHAFGNRREEWVFFDADGRHRFASEGGHYMPGGPFQHVHRPFRRFRIGDRAKARDELPKFWKSQEEAKIVGLGADQQHPVTAHFESPARSFNTEAWKLDLLEGESDDAGPGQAVAAEGTLGDDEDELPWQVVALMSEDSFEDLKRQKATHDGEVQAALASAGDGLPVLPSRGLHRPFRAEVDIWPSSDADKLCDAGRLHEALEAYDDNALAATPMHSGQDASLDKKALLTTKKAECLRRSSDPGAAHDLLQPLLGDLPRFAPAVFQSAMVLLDLFRPAAAVSMLERLLRLDREWPDLHKWLFHAHARARRQGQGPVAQGFCSVGDVVETREDVQGFWSRGEQGVVIGLGRSNAPIAMKIKSGRVFDVQTSRIKPIQGQPESALAQMVRTDAKLQSRADLYEVLGLRLDFTADELRRAFRSKSLQHHPDKGGATEVFQQVALANAVLSDEGKRKSYDIGGDLPPRVDGIALEREVLTRYFPDRLGWQAFGDPLERKRVIQERRRARQEL
eukprot:TRINITY_DN24431_c0_g1_i1.p1 TRINITY_DN24431_c0_g1~~TRINITY_DN24431_c0_g1_i1.p1  ORF type:complete len:618 (+),score=69.45 TRINITY_DN24431_c0_g1_i1:92-1945(+)